MKKSYSISISKPCGENWDNFTPQENGRHCSSCSKVVLDFTNMSDRQILEFLENKKSNTCGRFRHDQMKSYHAALVPTINPGLTLLKAGFMSLMFALISKETAAQELIAKVNPSYVLPTNNGDTYSIQRPKGLEMIQGVVKSAGENAPMPGVSIIIKGTTEGTTTDIDGHFSLNHQFQDGDVLVFNFIGYRTLEFPITQTTPSTIDVIFEEDYMELMGEIAVHNVYEEKSTFGKMWDKIKDIF
jgi:hypothetical protein